MLTDLVRSYTTEVQSVVPQFLAASFDMLRDGQSKMMENISNPMSAMPEFDAMKAQQEAFMKAMTGGWPAGQAGGNDTKEEPKSEGGDDLEEIKRQLAELQTKLSKLGS